METARIWSHLLKKPLMENFIFCAVWWIMRAIVWVIGLIILLRFLRKICFAWESYNQYDMQLTFLNSLVRFAVLFLEIRPKTIWSWIIAFFGPLIRNTSYIQYTQTQWLYDLRTRKNWVTHFNWINGKK